MIFPSVTGLLNQLSVLRAHLDTDKTLVFLEKRGGGGGKCPRCRPPSGYAPDSYSYTHLAAERASVASSLVFSGLVPRPS